MLFNFLLSHLYPPIYLLNTYQTYTFTKYTKDLFGSKILLNSVFLFPYLLGDLKLLIPLSFLSYSFIYNALTLVFLFTPLVFLFTPFCAHFFYTHCMFLMTSFVPLHVCMLSFFSHIQLFETILTTDSPPGSSVHGTLQARILEWIAMPSSRGSS